MSKRLCSIHGLWSKTTDQPRCPKCSKHTHKTYDKHKRDKESAKIYNSGKWRFYIRPKVLTRDAMKCAMCSRFEQSKNLIVDHIEELKDGGDPYDMNNLQTLCKPCHNSKTSKVKKDRS